MPEGSVRSQRLASKECFWNFDPDPTTPGCSNGSQVSLTANTQKRDSDLLGLWRRFRKVADHVLKNHQKSQLGSNSFTVTGRTPLGIRSGSGIWQKQVFLKILIRPVEGGMSQTSHDSILTIPASAAKIDLAARGNPNGIAQVRKSVK